MWPYGATWSQPASAGTQVLNLDFAGDPADEIIAATSLVHGIPLVTRDAAIRQSTRLPLATR